MLDGYDIMEKTPKERDYGIFDRNYPGLSAGLLQSGLLHQPGKKI
jgi:hypothetical protein